MTMTHEYKRMKIERNIVKLIKNQMFLKLKEIRIKNKYLQILEALKENTERKTERFE